MQKKTHFIVKLCQHNKTLYYTHYTVNAKFFDKISLARLIFLVCHNERRRIISQVTVLFAMAFLHFTNFVTKAVTNTPNHSLIFVVEGSRFALLESPASHSVMK